MKTSLHHRLIVFFALASCLGVLACKTSDPATGEKSGGGSPSAVTSKGGCYNAYYPASATLKKTYKTTFSGDKPAPSTHTESYSNVTNDGFTQKMEFAPQAKSGHAASATDVTLESSFKCNPEGIVAMEYGSLNTGQNTKFKFKTSKAEGVTFPSESDWKIGKKWQMSYQVEGQMTGAPSPAMNMAPKGTIVLDSEIVGEESVTVPAGTFQAFKVVMTINNKLNLNMMGRDIPMNNTFKTNAWFAKDVGMVKSQTEGIGAITELMSLTK